MPFQSNLQWTQQSVQDRTTYEVNHQIPVPDRYLYQAALNNAIQAWAFQQFAQYPGNPLNQEYSGGAAVVYNNAQGSPRNYPTNWKCTVTIWNPPNLVRFPITNVS
jgi:hypothetical protein